MALGDDRMMSRALPIIAAYLASLLMALHVPTAAASHTPKGDAGKMPDYAALALGGDGIAQDTLSLAVAAATELLGVPCDYETVCCLTANAFSPAIDPNEDCASWWHVDAGLADRCIETAARALGLSVRPVTAPPKDGMPGLATAVRAAMDQGCVVVTTGGWDTGPARVDGEWRAVGPHGFVPWGWAGIVTDADPESGTITGVHPSGHGDNAIVRSAAMWALSAGAARLSPQRADILCVAQAIARIKGSGPFASGPDGVYGLDAMELWTRQMETVPGFCEPCGRGQRRGWTDAADNSRALAARSQVAAGFLRSCSERAPTPAREHLEAASQRYLAVAALLKPTYGADGPESYRNLIGDLERQRAHSARVLRPALETLEAAAGHLEAALEQMLPAEASVADVPAGRGDGNEFVRGLEVLLGHAGHRTEYHTLMGDLGLAFVVQASGEGPFIEGALDVGWWPLDPVCIPTYLDFAGRAVGRRLYYSGGTGEYEAGVPETPPAWVRVSLATGRPALANHGSWKVVTAMDRETPALLGFCPRGTDNKSGRLDAPVWASAFVGGPVAPLVREAADHEALRHALCLVRDEVPLPGGYVTGQTAFSLWVRALGDMEHLGQARWHANMASHLSINRTSAVEYLTAMARRQPAAVSIHLQTAAGLYRKVLAELRLADLTDVALKSRSGREGLAQLVERVGQLEVEAAHELECAVEQMDRLGAQ